MTKEFIMTCECKRCKCRITEIERKIDNFKKEIEKARTELIEYLKSVGVDDIMPQPIEVCAQAIIRYGVELSRAQKALEEEKEGD